MDNALYTNWSASQRDQVDTTRRAYVADDDAAELEYRRTGYTPRSRRMSLPLSFGERGADYAITGGDRGRMMQVNPAFNFPLPNSPQQDDDEEGDPPHSLEKLSEAEWEGPSYSTPPQRAPSPSHASSVNMMNTPTSNMIQGQEERDSAKRRPERNSSEGFIIDRKSPSSWQHYNPVAGDILNEGEEDDAETDGDFT